MILSSAIGTFFIAVAFTVALWCILFGSAGALFARSRGGDIVLGAVWGMLLGPFGFAAIAWTTRGNAVSQESLTLEEIMEDLGDE